MIHPGSNDSLAAVFTDRSAADAAVAGLKAAGFRDVWLGLTKSMPVDQFEGVAPGRTPDTEHHMVASSSDGVLGAVGRFFSGEASLRSSLRDHGVDETLAARIDESIGSNAAVVVVPAGERDAEARDLLQRSGGTVDFEGHGFASFGAPRSRDASSVAGQADDLDRGTGRGASGGGLGATTGMWSEAASRKDMRANGIGDLPDAPPAQDGTPEFYERRSTTHDRA